MLPVVLGVLALASLVGCSWTGSDGAERTAILGFGYIVHTNGAGFDAQHTRVAGAMWSRQGGGFGLLQQHRVTIDPLTATNDVIALRVTPTTLSLTHERVTNSVNATHPTTP